MLELRHDVDQCAALGIAVTLVQERDYFAPHIPVRHGEHGPAAMGVVNGFQVLADAGEPGNVSQADRP